MQLYSVVLGYAVYSTTGPREPRPKDNLTESNMTHRFASVLLAGLLLSVAAHAQDRPRVEADGTIHVPAFDLPESAYLSDESRAAMKRFRDVYAADFMAFTQSCPNLMEAKTRDEMGDIRRCVANAYYQTNIYKDVVNKHAVDVSVETIGGVYTEVFTPTRGIAKSNRDRVLIGIHGGGFVVGSRYFSHTETIPVADLGAIKIVSPDYRMAPEYQHPAGIDDVTKVYRALLEDYAPANIGVYGCSAGAMLTAQAVAHWQREALPPPGAIGLFCAGAPMTYRQHPGVFKMSYGESAYLGSALNGSNRAADDDPPVPSPYFAGVDPEDPTVAPGDHDAVLAAFPPTLLISGTRDFALSGVLATHAKLVRLGVDADLHVWEGMGHATYAFNPRLPETDEVHQVIVSFFDNHLGPR